MKKYISMLLALAIVLSLGITGYAAGTTDYQITVNSDPSVQPSVNGVTFYAYKLFDVSYPNMPADPGSGAETYTYTASYGFSDFTFDPDGAGSAYQELKDVQLLKYLAGLKPNDSGLYAFAKSAYAHIQTKLAAEPALQNQAVAMEYKLSGKTMEHAVFNLGVPASGANPWEGKNVDKYLGPGYYLIYMGAAENAEYTGSLMMDTTNPQPVLELKAHTPTLKKEILEDSMSSSRPGSFLDLDYGCGDFVSFVLTADVPNMDAFKSYELQFHDQLPAELALGDSFTVVCRSASGNFPVSYQKATQEAADAAAEGVFLVKGSNNQFSLYIKDLKKLDVGSGTSVSAGDQICVNYTAQVTDQIFESDFAKNTAYLKFSNDPVQKDNLGKSPEVYTRIFDFGIDAVKVNGSNQSPLKDASFRLFTSGKGGEKGVPAAADRLYYSMIGHEVYFTDAVNDALILHTNEDGVLSVRSKNSPYTYTEDYFKGLRAGTYYLEEVEAPAGFDKRETPIRVEIELQHPLKDDNSEDITKISGYRFVVCDTLNKKDQYKVPAQKPDFIAASSETPSAVDLITELTVPNLPGHELPSTGGVGTTIFYVAGGLLMVGALVLLITKKKMSH